MREQFLHNRRGQRGQALLFAVLTIFILVVMIGVLIGVGEVATTQMRVQNAADAAVEAGAAVQADCLANIAWLNEGISEIYYQSLQTAADNVVAQTYAEMQRALIAPRWYPERVPNGDGGFLPAVSMFADEWSEVATTAASAPTIYARAQQLLNPDNGAAINNLSRLGIIQRTIATTAPTLVQHQIYHTVQANYYTDKDAPGSNDETARTAIFPADFSFYPEGMERHDVVIARQGDGWRLTSTTDPDYELVIEHIAGNDFSDTWKFYLRYPTDEGVVERTLNIHQEIYGTATGDAAIDAARQAAAARVAGSSCLQNYPASAVVSFYEITGNDYQLTLVVYERDGANAVVKVENGKTECIETLPDGVAINGMRYTRDEDGFLNKDGKRLDLPNSIEINGVKVPTAAPEWLGNIRLGLPIEFVVERLHCVLSRSQMHIEVELFPAGATSIDREQIAVNWLSTSNADGRWRERSHHRNNDGRNYHRMKVITPDQQWLYETIHLGSYLTDMSWRKMFTRAAARQGILPANWWYVPTGIGLIGGDPVDSEFEPPTLDDLEWEKSATGVWREFPEWVRPPRRPRTAKDLNFGGFMSVDRGRPVGVDGAEFAFSVTKPTPYKVGTYKYNRNVPTSIANSLFRDVHPITPAGRLGGPIVNPLMRFYYPPNTDAAAMAEMIDVSGNEFAGFWIEGGFKTDGELSPEERTAGGVSLESRLQEIARGVVKSWRLDPTNAETNLTFPCVAFTRGGLWYLQMFDPLGAVPLFRQEPRYYGDLTAFYDNVEQQPNTDNDRARIAQAPCLVRRTVGDVLSSLIEQGKIDNDDQDKYLSAGLAVNLGAVSPGLEARSELFRRPLVVGVHAPATIAWLATLLGGGDTLNVTEKWTAGHFALSAARLFFETDNEWVTNFAYGNAGKKYNTEFNDAKNIIGQALSGYQQKWQKSTRNLFVPTWSAALVPFAASLRLIDVYNDADEIAAIDNPTTYLTRQLRQLFWRKNLAENAWGNFADDTRVDLNAVTSPHGHRLNYAAPAMEEVIKH